MFSRSTSGTFNGSINVAFINITSYNISQQQRPVPTPRHAVFSFLISALLILLELKYQGNGIVSPFQTHPKIMWVALVSLILYCFAYAVELESKFTQLGRAGMGLYGSILSVSLAYVLSPNSVSFVLCFLCALFSNRELLCSYIEVILRWIQQRTKEAYSQFNKFGRFIILWSVVALARYPLFFLASPVLSSLFLLFHMDQMVLVLSLISASRVGNFCD